MPKVLFHKKTQLAFNIRTCNKEKLYNKAS